MPGREHRREEVLVMEPGILEAEQVGFRDGGGNGEQNGRVIRGVLELTRV